jgi:EAL domain-containing protein (putative c-di-GMP-specific phosphodiesterase class I)
MQAYEKRLSVETKLRHALEKNQFVLHYQPKVALDTGEIVGAEALIRWQTEDALIQPNDFIPLAEDTGLIIPIGLWCLEEACRQLKRWHQAGATLSLAVNLSARQFADRVFINSVEKIVSQSGIDPNYVTLELTESLLMDDLQEKLFLMQKLNDIGFKLSIDDFGTGYSSLSYLRKLPVHELKIDRSFIMETTKSENSRAIVATVIFLAKQLGLSTVAEGIEQVEELNFLQQLDCDQYQGFYFSRPVPCSEFVKLLNCDFIDMEGCCEMR